MICIVLFLFLIVKGRIDRIDHKGSDHFLITEGFGLEPSGTVRINLQFHLEMDAFVVVSVVDKSQLRNVMGSKHCVFRSEDRVQVFEKSRNPLNYSVRVERMEKYSVVVSNCEGKLYSMNGTIEFTNLMEEHLSYEDIPLIPVYALALSGDCIVMVVFLWMKRYHRVGLLLCIVLTVKMVYLMVLLWEYETFSRFGEFNVLLMKSALSLGDLTDLIGMTLILRIAGQWRRQTEIQLIQCILLMGLAFTFTRRSGLCAYGDFCEPVSMLQYALLFFLLFASVMAVNVSMVKTRETFVHFPEQTALAVQSQYFNTIREIFTTTLFLSPVSIVMLYQLEWHLQWMFQASKLLLYFLIQVTLVFTDPPME